MGQKNKKPDPNNPPPEDEDEDEGGDDAPPKRSEIMKMINGAVTGIFNRKLGPAIEAGMAPVLKKLEEFGGKKRDEDDDEDGVDDEDDDAGDPPAPPPKKNARPNRPDPQVAKLNKKLEDVNRQLKEAEEKRLKEETARKATLVDNALTTALTEIGVDKHRVRGALAVHRSMAAYDDESGQVIYKVKRDGYDEDLAPGDALKEWAATDEGKSYLAPTGSTGGSGTRPPKPAGPRGKPAPSSPEAKQQRVQEAKQGLLSAVGELTAGGSVVID